MKQQCYLAAIYLNWILLVGGVSYLLITHHLAFAIAWLIALPVVMWAYIRLFPSISQTMGYGRVDDRPVPSSFEPGMLRNESPGTVTIYTALGCPFCPIVEKRLRALQENMGFRIEKIDVTLRPDLLRSKGIRAVPVVEVGDRRLHGNATSEQLTRLIADKTSC